MHKLHLGFSQTFVERIKSSSKMNFEELVYQIELAHKELQSYAVRQVNNALTMRNILIGFYIVEYEQNGSDRANYGQETIKSLANRLKHIKGISKTQLYRFRDFYLTYPAIFSTVSGKLQAELMAMLDSSFDRSHKLLNHIREAVQ